MLIFLYKENCHFSMRKIYLAVVATSVLLLITLLALFFVGPILAQPSQGTQAAGISGNEKMITVAMQPADGAVRNDFARMQQNVQEWNLRMASYPVKQPYVPDNCDTGMRPRQWVAMHCDQSLVVEQQVQG